MVEVADIADINADVAIDNNKYVALLEPGHGPPGSG
jgi:hypothetical protein